MGASARAISTTQASNCVVMRVCGWPCTAAVYA